MGMKLRSDRGKAATKIEQLNTVESQIKERACEQIVGVVFPDNNLLM